MGVALLHPTHNLRPNRSVATCHDVHVVITAGYYIEQNVLQLCETILQDSGGR